MRISLALKWLVRLIRQADYQIRILKCNFVSWELTGKTIDQALAAVGVARKSLHLKEQYKVFVSLGESPEKSNDKRVTKL